jgi:hypothetical protein
VTYVNLGSRQKQGKTDLNNLLSPGAFTVAFLPADLVVTVPEYEVYHVSLTGPAGSTFQVYVNAIFYDNVLHGDINSWNPPQPMILRPGDSVNFYWSTNTPPAPLVSIFLRFDPDAQPLAGKHYS